MEHKRLGQMLIEKGLLTHEKVALALNVQNRTGERIGDIISRLGFADHEVLARAVAEQYGLVFIDSIQLKLFRIDHVALGRLTLDFARRHAILPAIRRGESLLIVADVLNTQANDKARSVVGARTLVLATRIAIAMMLETYAFGGKDGERIVESARETISSGQINELLGYLFGRAVLQGASDIHIEPSGPVSVVRFRVDGVLQPEISVPRERHENLVNVLFGKSGIDLSDFHRVRNGRFSFTFAGRALDVRFASSPTVEGPMVVMRILDDTRTLIDLKLLGYPSWSLAAIQRLIQHPCGVILIVGPTGSGKTTTLYSLLSTLNDAQKKILTVEDPVEIRLPSVQQVQVNEKAGVTFASCVRGFLRQDPDVILVGEIRDEETAREAFRAANTGHLVLTTLHANTALEAVGRLVDLGLEPYRVADGTIGIVGQRLLRRLCRPCKGAGCDRCSKGYAGRTVVAEVLELDFVLKTMIHERRPAFEMFREACGRGFKTMQENGRHLVMSGETSLAEAERVLGPLHMQVAGIAGVDRCTTVTRP